MRLRRYSGHKRACITSLSKSQNVGSDPDAVGLGADVDVTHLDDLIGGVSLNRRTS